jgi:hypothetical protein
VEYGLGLLLRFFWDLNIKMLKMGRASSSIEPGQTALMCCLAKWLYNGGKANHFGR